jgi:hypothetical protein
MRNGHFLTELSWRTLGYEAPQRLLEYLLGSLVVGPILALIVGAIAYGIALWWQEQKGTTA